MPTSVFLPVSVFVCLFLSLQASSQLAYSLVVAQELKYHRDFTGPPSFGFLHPHFNTECPRKPHTSSQIRKVGQSRHKSDILQPDLL